MKKMFALAAALIASASAFAFDPGMSASAVDEEVRQRMSKGESLAVMSAAGKSGSVQAGVMACSLVRARNASKAVVAAMIQSGYRGSEVVNGAICDGTDRNALVAIAIGEGVDPTSLLPGTAAGGQPEAGLGNAGGFNGAGFGPSPAATFGGGGRSSVSPS